MGYYTQYSLSIQEPEEGTTGNGFEIYQTILGQFRSEYEEAEFALDEDGNSAQSAKWYDHQEDLKEFSKKYPDHLFCLSCTGEEQEQWEVYAKNGKAKLIEPIITWPKFDELDLA